MCRSKGCRQGRNERCPLIIDGRQTTVGVTQDHSWTVGFLGQVVEQQRQGVQLLLPFIQGARRQVLTSFKGVRDDGS